MARRSVPVLLALLAGSAVFGQQPAIIRNTRMMAASDPNKNANWEWWNIQNEVDLYYSKTGGETPQLARKKLPWYCDGNLLKSYAPDIYPEDGWMLAYRDFGTPSSAPVFPYFVLYNKYRGKFRLMVFKPYDANNTHYLAEMSFLDDAEGKQYSGLLTFPNDTNCFLDDYSKEQRVSCISKMDVYGSWGVFDFDIPGYDPKLNDQNLDPVIQIAVRGVNVSSIKGSITGNMTLNQICDNASLSVSRASTAERLEGAIGSAVKNYKTIDKFTEDFNRAVTTKNDKGEYVNKDKAWFEAAQSLAPLIAMAGPWGAAVGAGMGLISGLIGGKNKQPQMQPINFKGMLNLSVEGTIVDSQATMIAVDLYLKPGQGSLLGQRPVTSIPWGVFNVKTKPMFERDIHWDRNHYWEFFPDSSGRGDYQWVTHDSYRYTTMRGSVPMIEINPECGMQLVSTKVRPGYKNRAYGGVNEWVAMPKLSFDFMDWCQWEMYPQKPDILGIELTFAPNAPTKNSDSQVVIYKSVPVGISKETWIMDTEYWDPNGPRDR